MTTYIFHLSYNLIKIYGSTHVARQPFYSAKTFATQYPKSNSLPACSLEENQPIIKAGVYM